MQIRDPYFCENEHSEGINSYLGRSESPTSFEKVVVVNTSFEKVVVVNTSFEKVVDTGDRHNCDLCITVS